MPPPPDAPPTVLPAATGSSPAAPPVPMGAGGGASPDAPPAPLEATAISAGWSYTPTALPGNSINESGIYFVVLGIQPLPSTGQMAMVEGFPVGGAVELPDEEHEVINAFHSNGVTYIVVELTGNETWSEIGTHFFANSTGGTVSGGATALPPPAPPAPLDALTLVVDATLSGSGSPPHFTPVSCAPLPAGTWNLAISCSEFTTSSWGSHLLTLTAAAGGTWSAPDQGTLNSLVVGSPASTCTLSLPNPAQSPPPVSGEITLSSTGGAVTLSGWLPVSGDTATVRLHFTLLARPSPAPGPAAPPVVLP